MYIGGNMIIYTISLVQYDFNVTSELMDLALSEESAMKKAISASQGLYPVVLISKNKKEHQAPTHSHICVEDHEVIE